MLLANKLIIIFYCISFKFENDEWRNHEWLFWILLYNDYIQNILRIVNSIILLGITNCMFTKQWNEMYNRCWKHMFKFP